jgi:hypothetical protein
MNPWLSWAMPQTLSFERPLSEVNWLNLRYWSSAPPTWPRAGAESTGAIAGVAVGGGVEPPQAVTRSPMARNKAMRLTWLSFRLIPAKSRMKFRRCRGVLFLLAIANINCPFQPRISMSLLEKNWAWKAQAVIIRQKRQAMLLALYFLG